MVKSFLKKYNFWVQIKALKIWSVQCYYGVNWIPIFGRQCRNFCCTQWKYLKKRSGLESSKDKNAVPLLHLALEKARKKDYKSRGHTMQPQKKRLKMHKAKVHLKEYLASWFTEMLRKCMRMNLLLMPSLDIRVSDLILNFLWFVLKE